MATSTEGALWNEPSEIEDLQAPLEVLLPDLAATHFARFLAAHPLKNGPKMPRRNRTHDTSIFSRLVRGRSRSVPSRGHRLNLQRWH